MERVVRITSGSPCKGCWGQEGVVIGEYGLNGEKHLLVDINSEWILVKEIYTSDFETLDNLARIL